jgi:thiamine biosynthesis lipoprotein
MALKRSVISHRCRAVCRLAALFAFSLMACTPNPHPAAVEPPLRQLHQVRYVMGTLLDITIYAPREHAGLQILDETFAIAETLDRKLSTYKPDSALSRFNAETRTDRLEVDPDLYRMLEESRRLSYQTDGAFDVSIRPLVTLWERAAATGVTPPPQEIASARAALGWRAFTLIPPSFIRKGTRITQAESGGIAKGMAVDAMADSLRQRGITSACINFGRSSIAAIGTPPGERGWKIELELTDGVHEDLLYLRDETLTVSRAKGNSFVVAGVTYAHIFDPSTGYPVTASRGAAVRGTAATAGEAYVKYLVVRGAPPRSISRRWNSAAWIVREGETVQRSEAW